jgi:hypothetical protein
MTGQSNPSGSGLLIDVAEFLIVAALWVLGESILLKRVKSRKKEDGDIQTVFGTKKPK